MKYSFKRLLCGALSAAMLAPAAFAASIRPSTEAITLEKGTETLSFVLKLTADSPFAGAEFGLKPSAEDVTLTSLEFLDVKGEPTVQTQKNGVLYFGFFSGSNKYEAKTYEVARLTYQYSGTAKRTISLDSSKIVTIDGTTNSTVGDTSSAPFTVTISRAGTTPSGGGGGGGGGSVSPGSSTDQNAADAVIKRIDAIGTVTRDSGSVITDAREAYDRLTDAQKKLVTNYDKLTAAEAAYARLTADSDDLPFIDVTGHWALDAIRYVYQNGLFAGTSATTFSPNMPMNRAMLVTVLYRMENEPAVSAASSFKDVPAGQWYTKAVAWASANQIVSGYSADRFGPGDTITREQMAAILHRYAQHKSYDVSKTADLAAFTDRASVSDWALPSMRWANAEKLINGRTAATLVPQGSATRAEVAQILMVFAQNVAK